MKNLLMDTEAIKKILPHREPFLFVDEILEMTESRIVGIKRVKASEPYFRGHFPAKPVMPGVLIVEALAQTGGVLMLSKAQHAGKLAYLVAVNHARFRKVVVPGDELKLTIETVKMKAKIAIVKGVATVGGVEVCDAEIMFITEGE